MIIYIYGFYVNQIKLKKSLPKKNTLKKNIDINKNNNITIKKRYRKYLSKKRRQYKNKLLTIYEDCEYG